MRDVVSIRLEDIVKRFGDVKAVNHVALTFDPGKLYVLLGPSGCGKTTTLRMISGLEELTSGSIYIGGEDVTNVPVHERDLGFVFQQYALFPHMSVENNVAFGLRMRRYPSTEIDTRVKASLGLVQLSGLERRRIRQLSGGQQQRVALARALVTEPRALLLDEPLSNLDKNLRDDMRGQIRDIQKRLGITTIMVTHDQTEALSMADEIVVMNNGLVEQVGTPEDIYRRPSSLFTAHFVGAANIIEGIANGNGSMVDSAGVNYRLPADRKSLSGKVAMMIRPSDIQILDKDLVTDGLDGTVLSSMYFGATRKVIVRLEGGRDLSIDTNERETRGIADGDIVKLYYETDSSHVIRIPDDHG